MMVTTMMVTAMMVTTMMVTTMIMPIMSYAAQTLSSDGDARREEAGDEPLPPLAQAHTCNTQCIALHLLCSLMSSNLCVHCTAFDELPPLAQTHALHLLCAVVLHLLCVSHTV